MSETCVEMPKKEDIDQLARGIVRLAPAIEAFFAEEKNAAAFEAWRARRSAKKGGQGNG